MRGGRVSQGQPPPDEPSPWAKPAAPYGNPQGNPPVGPPTGAPGGPSQPTAPHAAPGYGGPPTTPFGAPTSPYGGPTRPYGAAPSPFGYPGRAPNPYVPVPAPPDNYLVPAILATVFCCFLAGIPALYAATSVNERWLQGDQAGARDASLRARNWTIGAVLLGVIFWTTWMLGVFVLGWKETLGDL